MMTMSGTAGTVTTTRRLAQLAESARQAGLDVEITTHDSEVFDQVQVLVKAGRYWLQAIATRFNSGDRRQWAHSVFVSTSPTSKPRRVSMRYAHTWVYVNGKREGT